MQKSTKHIALTLPVAMILIVVALGLYLLLSSPAQTTGHEAELHTNSEVMDDAKQAAEEVVEEIEEAAEQVEENVEAVAEEIHDEATEMHAQGCDFDDWIGQNIAELDLEALERPHRVIEAGSMYTTDFVADRINVHVDQEGVVVKVTCG